MLTFACKCRPFDSTSFWCIAGAGPGSHSMVAHLVQFLGYVPSSASSADLLLLTSSGFAAETETDRRATLLNETRFAASLDDGACKPRRCGMDVHRLVPAEPCPSRTGSRVLSALTRCVQRPNRLDVAACFAQQRRSRSPRSHIWGWSSGVVLAALRTLLYCCLCSSRATEVMRSRGRTKASKKI